MQFFINVCPILNDAIFCWCLKNCKTSQNNANNDGRPPTIHLTLSAIFAVSENILAVRKISLRWEKFQKNISFLCATQQFILLQLLLNIFYLMRIFILLQEKIQIQLNTNKKKTFTFRHTYCPPPKKNNNKDMWCCVYSVCLRW